MEELKNEFIAAAKAVVVDNQVLSTASIGIHEIFFKPVVRSHKSKVQAHFDRLIALDQRYANFLKISGSLNDLQVLNAKIQVLTCARLMITGALKDYESALTEFEGQVQFRLSMTVSVVALLVSLVGIKT